MSGATWLGILGGGQLGRYLVLAARRRGVRTFVVDPSPEAPALREADAFRVAPFDDPQALGDLAAACGVATWETESVPATALARLEGLGCAFRPGRASLGTCQDRLREKAFLRGLGIGTADWWPLAGADDLPAAREAARAGGILKTAREGYDGKGQVRLAPGEDLEAAWERLGRVPCVLEAFVPFRREVSVLAARDRFGGVATHAPIENLHRDGVLDVSHFPAPFAGPEGGRGYEAAAARIVAALGHVGILAVEFFEGPDGRPLVNELAPRPHNSGHVTLESPLSQFDQHLRCVLGEAVAPFSTPEGNSIANLMGALWEAGEPLREGIAGEPVRVELYGKRPRPGRKMGHLAFRAASPGEAQERAAAWRERLRGS